MSDSSLNPLPERPRRWLHKARHLRWKGAFQETLQWVAQVRDVEEPFSEVEKLILDTCEILQLVPLGREQESMSLAEDLLEKTRFGVLGTSCQAWALYVNGEAHARFGDLEVAVLCLQRARNLFRDLNDDEMSADCILAVVETLEGMGDWQQAKTLLKSALSLAEKSQVGVSDGFRSVCLGQFYRLSGKLAEAVTHYELALHFFQHEDAALGECVSLLGLARVSALGGTDREGLEICERLYRRAKGIHAKPLMAHAEQIRGQLFLLFGDVGRATAALSAASELFKECGLKGQIEAYFHQSLLLDPSSPLEKRKRLEAIQRAAQQSQRKGLQLRCRLERMACCGQDNDWDGWDVHFQWAVAMLESSHFFYGGLGEIWQKLGDMAAACGGNTHQGRAARVYHLAKRYYALVADERGQQLANQRLQSLQVIIPGTLTLEYDLLGVRRRTPASVTWTARHYQTQCTVLFQVFTVSFAESSGLMMKVESWIRRVQAIEHPGFSRVIGWGVENFGGEADPEDSLYAGDLYVVRENVESEQFSTREWSGLELVRWILEFLDILSALHGNGVDTLGLESSSLRWRTRADGSISAHVDQMGLEERIAAWSGERSDGADGRQVLPKEKTKGGGEGRTDLFQFASCVHYALNSRGASRDRRSRDTLVIAVCDWLEVCMKHSVEERYQSVEEAAMALRKLSRANSGAYNFAAMDNFEELDTWLAGLDEPDTMGDEEHLSLGDPTREILVNRSSSLEDELTIATQTPSWTASVEEDDEEWTLIGARDDETDEHTQTAMHPRPVAQPNGGEALSETGDVEEKEEVPPSWREVFGVDVTRTPEEAFAQFGSLAVPFFARKEERDALWHGLLRCLEQHGAGGVVLRADAGLGKSRLAQWLEEVVRTWGAADTLWVHADWEGGLHVAMAQAIGAHLRVRGLRHESLVGRLSTLMPSVPEVERRALGRLLCDVIPPEERTIGSLREDRGVLIRYLARRSEKRPLVLFLENFRPSSSTVSVVKDLMAVQVPVFIVVCELGDEETIGGIKTEKKEVQFPDAMNIVRLAPLSVDELACFVQHAAGLRADLSRRVARLTEGNPQLAMQLLSSLMDRGALRLEEHGVRLRPGEKLSLTSDRTERWDEQLSTAFRGLATPLRQALLLGAVLGRRVSMSLWKEACEEAGIHKPVNGLRMLADRGWLRIDSSSWVIVERELYAACLRRGASLGETPGYHRAILRALRENGDTNPTRLSRHLYGASLFSEALPLLLEDAELNIARGDLGRAAVDLERAGVCLSRLELEQSHVLRGTYQLVSLDLKNRLGGPEAVRIPFRQLEARARDFGWSRILYRALRRVGDINRWLGEPEKSNIAYTLALKQAVSVDDWRETTQCLYGLAVNARICGSFSEAADYFEQTFDASSSHSELPFQIYALLGLGATRSAQGRTEDAVSCFQRASERAKELGWPNLIVDATVGLGEVHKVQGELEKAARCYEQARRFLIIGSGVRYALVELNICSILMARREFSACYVRVEKILDILKSGGMKHGYVAGRALQMPHLVRTQSEQKWNASFEELCGLLEGTGYIDQDIAGAFELAAEGATERGRKERAVDLFRRAEEHWDKLGRDDQKESASARRRRLEDQFE